MKKGQTKLEQPPEYPKMPYGFLYDYYFLTYLERNKYKMTVNEEARLATYIRWSK